MVDFTTRDFRVLRKRFFFPLRSGRNKVKLVFKHWQHKCSYIDFNYYFCQVSKMLSCKQTISGLDLFKFECLNKSVLDIMQDVFHFKLLKIISENELDDISLTEWCWRKTKLCKVRSCHKKFQIPQSFRIWQICAHLSNLCSLYQIKFILTHVLFRLLCIFLKILENKWYFSGTAHIANS